MNHAMRQFIRFFFIIFGQQANGQAVWSKGSWTVCSPFVLIRCRRKLQEFYLAIVLLFIPHLLIWGTSRYIDRHRRRHSYETSFKKHLICLYQYIHFSVWMKTDLLQTIWRTFCNISYEFHPNNLSWISWADNVTINVLLTRLMIYNHQHMLKSVVQHVKLCY